MRKWIGWLNRIFFADLDEIIQRGNLDFWKNKIYRGFASAFLIFGTPLLLYGAYLFYLEDRFKEAAVEAGVCMVMFIVITNRRINLEDKKLVIVSILYFVSLMLLLTTGERGAGLVCVAFTLVLSANLLGSSNLKFFIVTNLIAFVLMTAMLRWGLMAGLPIEGYKGTWLINAATTQISSLILAYLIHTIYGGIDRQGELIKSSEEKYRLLAENASDMIWIYNLNRQCFTYISSSVWRMRGYTVEEAMQQSLEQVLTAQSYGYTVRMIQARREDFVRDPDQVRYYLDELQQLCKNGDITWVECSTNFRYNSLLEIEIIGVTRNIQKRKASEEAVLYLSYHDQLTGLYNRRFYEEELMRLDTQRNYPIAIVMIDVNGLKMTNDAFGHLEGDKLLKQVAAVLKMECRVDDILCRIGGDEFVLLLPKTGEADAQCIINRIKTRISEEKNERIILSVAIGHAIKNSETDQTERIFKEAEDRMYNHKMQESTGIRNRTVSKIMESLCSRSYEEKQHSEMVGAYSERLALAMGLDEASSRKIRMAGLMHDIGKIGVDANILNKSELLSGEEWREVMRHSEIGYYLLNAVNEYSDIADVVLEHHERWDGKGYPKGLKGEKISKEARIIAIADAYEAITAMRPHHNPHGRLEAIDELWANAGTQFDPEMVKIFIDKVVEHMKD